MDKRICLNKSVLDFMESVLTPESWVLEIGGGYSTRWFADRCFQLDTVETDAKWQKIIWNEMMPSCPCHFSMNSTIEAVQGFGGIDLALIDCVEGLREKAARVAWDCLWPGGWLVFDDAQRSQHARSITWLVDRSAERFYLRWCPGDIETAKERLAIAFKKEK